MTLLSVRSLVRLLNTVEPVEDLPDATGIAFDSRRVRPGDAFFALPGESGHGIDFADDAVARGAALIVSDRPHRRGLLVDDARAAILALGRAARDRLAGPVVGITGSAGKTSTKALLAAALPGRSTPGNMNTHYAIASALVSAALEDADLPPDASGAPLVLELGIDRPGEMTELLELTRPDHALLTTVGASHTQALGDVAGVAREKALLLERTPGVKVVGAAAALYLDAATLATTVVVDVVGKGAPLPPEFAGAAASAVGSAEELPGGRTALRWRDAGETGAVTLPWPGRAMAQNALAAAATATRLGSAQKGAWERMAQAKLEHGRLERRELQGLTLIDDSYNSNPASLVEALEVLRAAPAPRAAFLGDMRELGSLDRESHLRAGEATLGLDLVVAVGPSSAALQETNPAAVHVPDAAAACALLERVPRGATLLVKGSRSVGMERVAEAARARASAGAWRASGETVEEGTSC